MLLLIPAMDIKEGRCVQMVQGVEGYRYSDDPVEMARLWRKENAKALHERRKKYLAYVFRKKAGGFLNTARCLDLKECFALWESYVQKSFSYVNFEADRILHIKYEENSTGIVELWGRTQGTPWPSSPNLSRYNVPTMPYSNAANVHNDTLYTMIGLYPSWNGYNLSETFFFDDFHRGNGFSAVAPQ